MKEKTRQLQSKALQERVHNNQKEDSDLDDNKKKEQEIKIFMELRDYLKRNGCKIYDYYYKM